MSQHTINESRLLELGEAERRLNWAIGTVQDFINGRPEADVFAELVFTLTADKYSEDAVNDPDRLTPQEVLNG